MTRSLIVLAAILALSSVNASATLWNLYATLDGLQETPPVATPGYGSGTLTLDDVTGQVIASGSFYDLIGTANNAHIHGLAPPGTPAGVILPLTFTASTSGTFSGNGFLSPANVTGMLNGQTYFNIHSTFRPGGEIRGQIYVVPEPSLLALAGLAIGGLLTAARSKRKNAPAA